MSGDDPLENPAENEERDKQNRIRNNANWSEPGRLAGGQSFGDNAYRPGVSDRSPQSLGGDAKGDSRHASGHGRLARGQSFGDNARPGVSDRLPQSGGGDPRSAPKHASDGSERVEHPKSLGELPPMPETASPFTMGLRYGEGVAQGLEVLVGVAGAEMVAGVLGGVSHVLTLTGMAVDFLEARSDWRRNSGMAFEREGISKGLDPLSRDARSADNRHIEKGEPYTAKELFERIAPERSINWLGMVPELAGLGGDRYKAEEHIRKGLADLADAINHDVLRPYDTPERRKAGLDVYVSALRGRMDLDRQQRDKELRDRKRRR